MRAIALAQAAMGAALCVVSALIATRVFRDRRAGPATGLLLAVYAPLIYVEVSLFAEGLFTFLLVLALWMFGRGQHPIAVGLLMPVFKISSTLRDGTLVEISFPATRGFRATRSDPRASASSAFQTVPS